MTLKERLEIVKEYRKWFEETNGKNDFDLLDCPETLMAFLQNRGLLNERSKSEWIPVSERLPNRNGVYNVTRKLNEGETIYFISDASYFDGQNTWHADTGINHGRPYLTDIIAWQSLPEPYKEGGAE